MKTKLITLTALMLLAAVKLSAQSLSDTKISEATSVIRIYYTFNKITNPNHEDPDFRSVPFKTIGLDIEFFDFDKGDSRWSIQSKVIDDMIWLIGSTISKREDRDDNSVTGVLGLKYGKNLFSTNKLNISAGFSLSDYIVILPKVLPSGDPNYPDKEPDGWYWSAGPNLFLDYHIFDSFTIHANINYDLPFLKLGEKDTDLIEGYKKPNFLGTRLTLHHDIGFFVQFQTTTVLDRGIHNQNITRREIQLGYRFLLGN